MLWLKLYVVPTLPHEVVVADMVYPVVLLVHGRSLSLLSTMVGYLQSGLRTLCQSLCNVIVEKDREGNMVVRSDGGSRVKTPNPRVELPYTYLIALYVMHCPSLMSAVQSSEDSHAIRPAAGAFGLEWLVYAEDPANSSKQHELPVSTVFP